MGIGFYVFIFSSFSPLCNFTGQYVIVEEHHLDAHGHGRTMFVQICFANRRLQEHQLTTTGDDLKPEEVTAWLSVMGPRGSWQPAAMAAHGSRRNSRGSAQLWEAQGSEPKLGSSRPRAGFPAALGD